MSLASGVRETIAVYDLSVRVEPERGGAVRPEVLDPAGVGTRAIRHLLILVHGFNNSRSAAEASFDRMIERLKPGLLASRVAPEAVARFQWPGNAAVGPFAALDFLGYPVDIERARDSAVSFGRYLSDYVASAAPGSRVSLIGHSLGCRLLLEMFARHLRAAPGGAGIDVVCLMAPAVPVDLATSGAPLAGTAATARVMLKAFSANDAVLRFAFPSGQLLAVAMNIEPAFYDEAVGLHGNPAGYGVPLPTANGHGAYWGDGNVADAVVEQIDPTRHRGPAARTLESRALTEAPALAGRSLPPARSLA